MIVITVLLSGASIVYLAIRLLFKHLMRRASFREEQLKQMVERRFRSVVALSGKSGETFFADMITYMNEYQNGIIDWLRDNHRDLSDSDVEIVCLLFFKFSPQELCVIYGLENVGAIYTRCSRVSKKLKINKNTSIGQFLEEKIDELSVQKCCLSCPFFTTFAGH